MLFFRDRTLSQRLIRLFALLATLGLCATAVAQQAFTTARTHLRAGPDRGYPLVMWLPMRAPVYVNGCVRNYHWCDVTAGGNRGWVNTRHLNYSYQNRNVLIWGNGALLGLPIIGYSAGSYWDNHYRGQRWYGDRARWSNWQPGQRAPQFAPAPTYVAPPRPVYVAPRPVYVPPPRPVQVAPQPPMHRQGAHGTERHGPAQQRGMGPAPVR